MLIGIRNMVDNLNVLDTDDGTVESVKVMSEEFNLIKDKLSNVGGDAVWNFHFLPIDSFTCRSRGIAWDERQHLFYYRGICYSIPDKYSFYGFTNNELTKFSFATVEGSLEASIHNKDTLRVWYRSTVKIGADDNFWATDIEGIKINWNTFVRRMVC